MLRHSVERVVIVVNMQRFVRWGSDVAEANLSNLRLRWRRSWTYIVQHLWMPRFEKTLPFLNWALCAEFLHTDLCWETSQQSSMDNDIGNFTNEIKKLFSPWFHS